MSYPRGSNISAYKSVAAHSMVMDAQPHDLVLKLLDGALERLQQARAQMGNGNKISKAMVLHRVVQILDELSMSINHAQGGEIAKNLSDLYDYMSVRVMKANLHDDSAALEEVSKLLLEIRSAWAAIAPGTPNR